MNEADDIRRLLLQDDAAQDEEALPIPQQIPITKGALEKAYMLCDAVKKVGKSSYEWFSFLLAQKSDPECIIRDLLLVKGTLATMGHVTVPGEAHAQAAAEIKKINEEGGTDYYSIGWLHSHGNGTTYHSDEDERNFLQLLNTVRFNTQQQVPVRFELIESAISQRAENGQLILSGEQLEDAIVKYRIPPEDDFAGLLVKYGLRPHSEHPHIEKNVPKEQFLNDLLSLLNMTTEESSIVGFAYSIVVNEKREHNARLASAIEKPLSKPGKIEVSQWGTTLEIREVENDIVVDADTLEALVKERVQFYVPQTFTSGPRKRRRRGKGLREKHSQPVGQWLSQGTYDAEGWNEYIILDSEHEYGLGDGSVASERYASSSSERYGAVSEYSAKKELAEGINAEELLKLFILRVASYQTLYQYKSARYSQYLDTVLRHVIFRKFDLYDAIVEGGTLKEDSDFTKEPSYHRSRYFAELAAGIAEGIPQTMEGLGVDFMFAFLQSENKALEKYVPLILADATKSGHDDADSNGDAE